MPTPAYNAFSAACPTREVLNLISGKWVGLTLTALAQGTQRYGELAGRIGGISHKMLTQTLRMLEQNGLVERKVTPTIPVTVDYSLTPLGSTLVPVVAAVKAWAEANVEQVRAAAASYEMPLGGGAETAALVAERASV
ncbi:helix-turn-helix transcriptional regulator [Kibdelosporangium philippinense]|uniref:Helix-turn-helix transcriptional regulator n=1 Tax=Kibdelosporangium philippinense TaxID=211113 RepID=A0ABS8ZG69_9PSEU|nr:helix-turn-helix domain-containing protein [Kibdelosporangium philippinense]MCE7006816.1 helix-turn-helix transcriptional regulator [Kibdelosporangium philippinense]